MSAAASLGRIAFAAHSKAMFLAEGFTGPKTWGDITDAERAGWDAAADAVVHDFITVGGRCGECFGPLVPTKHRPELSTCPVHHPEGH